MNQDTVIKIAVVVAIGIGAYLIYDQFNPAKKDQDVLGGAGDAGALGGGSGGAGSAPFQDSSGNYIEAKEFPQQRVTVAQVVPSANLSVAQVDVNRQTQKGNVARYAHSGLITYSDPRGNTIGGSDVDSGRSVTAKGAEIKKASDLLTGRTKTTVSSTDGAKKLNLNDAQTQKTTQRGTAIYIPYKN